MARGLVANIRRARLPPAGAGAHARDLDDAAGLVDALAYVLSPTRPRYRSRSVFASTGNVSSQAIPLPDDPVPWQAGDVVLLECTNRVTAAGFGADPAGWTLLGEVVAAANSGAAHAVYARVMQAGDTDPTVTCTSGRLAVVAVAISDPDPAASPPWVAVIDPGPGAATASVVAPSANASSALDLLVTGHASGEQSGGTGVAITATPPSGMFEVGDTSTVVGGSTSAAIEVAAELLAASGATGTRTATASLSVYAMGSSVIIKAAGGGTAHTETFDDNAVPTDTLVRTVTGARTLDELPTPTPTDALADVVTAARTLADDAVPTDLLTYSLLVLHTRTLDELPSPTDTATRVLGASRTLDELPTPTDVLARTMAAARTLDDLANPTDALSYNLLILHTRTLDDLANPTDVAARVVAAARVLDDLGTPTDLADRVVAAVRTASDNAVPTDALTYAVMVLHTRTLDDSGVPTDTLARTAAAVVTIDEAAAPTDPLATVLVAVRQAVSDAGLTDATDVVWTSASIPQWRGRLGVVAVGPSVAVGRRPAMVVPSGPTEAHGG